MPKNNTRRSPRKSTTEASSTYSKDSIPKCKRKGCKNKTQQGGICSKHGGTQIRSKCTEEGCTNGAVKEGVCRRHGATAKKCSYEGCTNHAQKDGLCMRHGAYKDDLFDPNSLSE